MKDVKHHHSNFSSDVVSQKKYDSVMSKNVKKEMRNQTSITPSMKDRFFTVIWGSLYHRFFKSLAKPNAIVNQSFKQFS